MSEKVSMYVLVSMSKGIKEARKNEAQALVVFPCVLKILPQYIFNKKDPIVIGSQLNMDTCVLFFPKLR